MTTHLEIDRPANGARWRVIGWGLAASLLLIPAIGMQVSREWQWTAGDFIAAAAVISIAGLILEGAVRLSGDWRYRAGFALVLVPTVMTLWINAAVGIVGDPDDTANLPFLGVLVTGMVVGLTRRLRPRGMMFAALAAAVVQIAAGIASYRAEPVAAAMSAVFLLCWLGAAALFAQGDR